jgi:toxin-antitoxin system PIN domain toxin
VIAVDTNLLVYAHRADSEWNASATDCIADLAAGAWAIPWPCLHEFYAIVTHPKIYNPPSKPAQAIVQIEAWLESPGLVLLGEEGGYWESLRRVLESGRITGPRVHDARVAAICLTHNVRELWTADRDFSRFSALRTRNPLAGK